MKPTVLCALLFIPSAALAEQDMFAELKAVGEHLFPLKDCLKTSFENARPNSDDEARVIMQSACGDVAADVRGKMLDAYRRGYPSPPRTHGDPEKIVDWAIGVTRIAAYWDFTGKLRQFQAQAKERLYRRWRRGDP
jgi:hypothetical protein